MTIESFFLDRAEHFHHRLNQIGHRHRRTTSTSTSSSSPTPTTTTTTVGGQTPITPSAARIQEDPSGHEKISPSVGSYPRTPSTPSSVLEPALKLRFGANPILNFFSEPTSNWPPEEWFQPISLERNRTLNSSYSSAASTDSSTPVLEQNNYNNQQSKPTALISSDNRLTTTSSSSSNSLAREEGDADEASQKQLQPIATNATRPFTNPNSSLPSTSSFSSFRVTDSPTNTRSIVLNPDQSQLLISDSPINTQSIAPIPDQPQLLISDSPINTQSIAPIPDQPQLLISDSPTNTQSIANIPPQTTPDSTLFQSPTNTQSIAPNQESVTPSSPHIPTSPRTPSRPPLVGVPRSPGLGHVHNKSSISFKPPPIHPTILAQKNGGEIGVKETLDAHSSWSEDGEKQINQYIIKQEIGRGSFGAVQLVMDAETGLEYAMKEVSKSRLKRKFAREVRLLNKSYDERSDALFLIRNEVAIMKKVRHPNVVRLYEVLDVEGQDSLYMVMEYCRGGPLMSIDQKSTKGNEGLTELEEDLARKYFRQLVLGIDYLHANEIIHHDIKPDNILLTSDRKQIKIVDFGISAMCIKPGDENNSLMRAIGSPAFVSPELIQSEDSSSNTVSGTAADIWAMGVTLYCMLTGRLPFGGGQMMDMYQAIQHEAPRIPEEWDAPLIDLISQLLDKDPKTRIKMQDIKKHSWVTDCGRYKNVENEEMREMIKINSQKEINESFRFGICNSSKNFKEIIESSLNYCKFQKNWSCKRKEFFKEFYKQISDRACHTGHHDKSIT